MDYSESISHITVYITANTKKFDYLLDEDINSETTTVKPDDKPKPEELTVPPPTTTPKPGPISLKN